MPKATCRPIKTVERFDPILLFEQAAALWPERPALQVGGEVYSYQRLDGWSDAIAERIVRAGHQGRRVAFVATKEASSYAAILGILKAGCAYVPLPAEGPAARWSSMLDQAGVQALVGDVVQAGLTSIPSVEGHAVFRDRPVGEEAYVLFTSGSTGGPKGVSVSRANVAAYLAHQRITYSLNEHDRFSQFFALTFDLSVHDIFLCWSVGACSCVPSAQDMLRAVTFARDERITVWFSVPSLAMLMHRTRALTPGSLSTVRLAYFCGEPLTWPVARVFGQAAPQARVINLYGPTEATIAITAYELGPRMGEDGIVPIGKVFNGSIARVVEEELQLGGPQVSAGYVGNTRATEAAFITDAGVRWYRTGDRVRKDAEGVFHFLGRIDDQVKIMGHRVEPSEVDVALGPLVQGSVFTVAHRGADRVRLYTFVDVPFDHAALMNELRTTLPAYMLPERIIGVETMPTTPHGKLDRKALLALIEHG